MRVLVIEDDRSVRETLGIVLESYGYHADLVDDEGGALKQLDVVWPDVLLLDLSLEETTGEQVYSHIRERFGRVPPTVVLSAVQHAEDRVRNMPGVLFLAKPYTLDQLVGVLQSAAASKEAA
jgi:two-component system, OmpR family, KDP operon response regulator KdpE